MRRRILTAAAVASAACLSAESVSAQHTSMSDATGATVGLFSRGVVRAFGAPPAPPPVLQVTPAMLDALCVERADAMLTFATLAPTTETKAQHIVLTLLRGGPAGESAATLVLQQLVLSGAALGEAEQLLAATHGLLAPSEPGVVNVAAAVNRYNQLVATAPTGFLEHPPAELEALRLALGRLSAAANHAYAAERVYPGLPSAGIRYANGAAWLLVGQPIEINGITYTPYGATAMIGERSFRPITDYRGVWVLAEEPVVDVPTTVYVPLRKSCDVELMPYTMEEKVIKQQSLLKW